MPLLHSHIYINSHDLVSEDFIIQINLFPLKFRGEYIWAAAGSFLQAFGGLENTTSEDDCPPMEAPPGPMLVPALAGISGGDLSCDCHSRSHPWGLHPAAACWGIALGNLMGHLSCCALGLHLLTFQPLKLAPVVLTCAVLWLCPCLASNPPDPNIIQKTDLKK